MRQFKPKVTKVTYRTDAGKTLDIINYAMSEQEQIIIYQTKDGQAQIEVNLQQETVWLSQAQMVELFGKSKKTISEHINNVFKEGELQADQVVRKFRTTAPDGKNYVVNHYNLDVIISVGYRVKSRRGTQFRIWATSVLKDYLVQGYALNQQRLQEAKEKLQALQEAVSLFSRLPERKSLSATEAESILSVLNSYSYGLEILDQYDHQSVEIRHTQDQELFRLTYEEAIRQIRLWRETQQAGPMFGNEKDDSFRSSLETIYQTFDSIDLYPSVEEKAAHLLYFIIKNHSFTDGNKRIGAGLFVWFLERNKLLYRSGERTPRDTQAAGQKRIADNALVALTLMIATSRPEEKEIIIKVIVNLINQKN